MESLKDSNVKITHAEAFNKWYSERMGHPFAVQLGKNAVDELQKENVELREALKNILKQIAKRAGERHILEEDEVRWVKLMLTKHK